MGQVVLKGINKFYDSVHAVRDINLQIRDKEFVVFVGPSGCGKTTTLRMIAGLEAISSGDISIDGNVVNQLAPMDRDIAMVFQNYALYPHMSVYDNMAFGLKMRNPRVFLFDEPLSNLDAKLRVQMRVELKKLHLRLGTTAIYVTHDQVEAMTLGDRVVVMKDGVVQQVGEPLELYNQPANKFVAGFIGSPAMNFAAVTVTEANGSLIAENAGLRIKLPDDTAQRLRSHIGREVTLGVRPEDLTVASTADLDHLCFDAVIEVVEQLGSEILLDMKVGEGVMVACVEPTVRVKVRDKLRVAMRPSRLHVFDAKTEAAI
jgi:multiple sugar transport system ATP-binding protein